MWERTKICVKSLRYVLTGLNMWEMAQICGKLMNDLGNDLHMWLKYLANCLDMCETA